MKRIYLLLLAVATIAIWSCTKDEGEKYIIKGRLLKSCDNPEPVAGQNLILEKYVDGSRYKYETIAATTTDENGAYSFSYSSVGKNSSAELSISPQTGQGSYLTNIPKDENIDMNIYARDNYLYVIKIKTNKPYTDKDTLFCLLSAKESYYIIGPFTDNQILDTVVRTNGTGWYYGQDSPKLWIGYVWKLGSRYNDPAMGNFVGTYLTPCKKYDEVVLDLTKAIK